MIAFCKQCGIWYQVDSSATNTSTARLNCRYCRELIFVGKCGETQGASNTFGDNVLNSPLIESDEVDNNIKNSSAIKPTSSPLRKILFRENTKRYNFSLMTKVIILMLFVSLVPFCKFGLVVFKAINKQIRPDIENLIDQVTSNLVINVKEWIDKNISALKAPSKLEGMSSMDPFHQIPLPKTIQKQYPWVYSVFVTGIRGKNISRIDDKVLLDYSDRQDYKHVMLGNERSRQFDIGKNSAKSSFVLVIPIIRDGSCMV